MTKQVVLVTGASRGIGAAIMHHLAADNRLIIGTATSDEGAQKISKNCQANNIQGAGYVFNLNQPETIDEMLLHCQQELGALPSILINNAGITKDNLSMRMKSEEWSTVLETNLTAVFQLTQKLLKPMIKNRWGRVINIGSVIGSTGNPGQANYAAAKSGLLGLSMSLASEVAARNITINTISPGFIETDMTKKLNDAQRQAIIEKVPMRRIGEPDDVASLVRFLASDEASYITGGNFHVNGGMFMA